MPLAPSRSLQLSARTIRCVSTLLTPSSSPDLHLRLGNVISDIERPQRASGEVLVKEFLGVGETVWKYLLKGVLLYKILMSNGQYVVY
jgi:hypothetical protein